MIKLSFATALIATVLTFPANAEIVYDTSLTGPSGAYGSSSATTTVDASGTRTTVVGPAGGANRASSTPSLGNWFMANVGGGATVGVTTDYAASWAMMLAGFGLVGGVVRRRSRTRLFA